MYRINKAPGSTKYKLHGIKRTKRHMRQRFGDPQPAPQPSALRTFRTIAYFAVFGLIIIGTLYWLFG